MKSVPARLDKLEQKLGNKDDDVCMAFVPTGDRQKDEEKLQKLRDVSDRTGKPVIIFDT
jgi:hypothetical protein